MFMKRLLLILLAAALLLSCAACGKTERAASVTFFKAGKADAAVIQTENSVILIDTGLEKNDKELVASLRSMGVERIDVLILSHFDKDHVGGADDILAAFPVGVVYQSNYAKDSDDYAEYIAALAEQGVEPVTVTDTVSFTLDGLTVDIDGPAETEYADDPSNNSSLIASVTCGDTTLLFAGDAQDARITEYLAAYERPEGTVILKVPYHGHWQQTLSDFLSAVRPDYAVLCCSKSEPEESELTQTTALLEGLGAQVYRTCDGDVSFSLNY